ncbi:MAG: hypothetical protein ACRDIB_05965, partial [Ardenticatenaceae bacterium]
MDSAEDQPTHGPDMNTGGGASVTGDVHAQEFVGRDHVVHGDEVGGDKIGGDKVTTGNIERSVVVIGRDASVNLRYYPIELRAPLRQNFAPLIRDRTQLFAGRAEVLQQIAAFIQNPAGGYLVITAPAGFGKTALMAHLVNSKPEAFAYHFFDRDYADSLQERFFLRNVLEQMAQWYRHVPWYDQEKELPDEAIELSALYYRFIAEPLACNQVLVLDGLDAVTEWRLARYLSTPLPADFHVILTVREEGQRWLEDYRLPAQQITHLSLLGLQREEVAEVLRAAGGEAATLAADPTRLDEIMAAVTAPGAVARGADPAYVRRYAEAAARGEQLWLHPPPLEQLESDADELLEERRHNLRLQLTPLIGREREMAAALQLVRRADVRLVTLTGPAGTGKSRLSEEVAIELLDDFKDGVFFVSLASISDPALVASAI